MTPLILQESFYKSRSNHASPVSKTRTFSFFALHGSDTVGSEKRQQTKIVLVTKPDLTQDFPQLTRGHHCYTFKGMPQSRI